MREHGHAAVAFASSSSACDFSTMMEEHETSAAQPVVATQAVPGQPLVAATSRTAMPQTMVAASAAAMGAPPAATLNHR